MSTPSETLSCDLLVVGAGAGGLATAVTAATLGLHVIVVEKEPVFGGTAAWSGGWMWIPRNPLAVEGGIREPLDGPRTYLLHELDGKYDPARIDAFLVHGPRMVEFFRTRTSLQFIDGNAIPDFHDGTPGALRGGRSVCAAPFDARALGPRVRELRPPLDLVSPWGMGIASGAELRHFLNAVRSWSSFAYVARRTLAHFRDRLLHGRGMRLVNGNALAGRLAKSAFDLGVDVRVSTPAKRLVRVDGRVIGAIVESQGREHQIRAARGVVLACGGFPHDVARRRAVFPHAPTGREHWSAAPPSNTGDGLRLGEHVGGVVDTSLVAPAGWAPVSIVRRRDGTIGHFPHLVERGKPGVIAVTRNGRRFTNEAESYHDFTAAMIAVAAPGEAVEAWLVCDHRFIRRYGLGHVRPAPFPVGPAVRSGYVSRAASIEALARACGIDAAALVGTVERYNLHARQGRDPEFGRGETPYNRVAGDATQQPNPCVAPIEHPPYYAVRVLPGSLGTFIGLVTDAKARVLDGARRPIPGLYAVGADMASVMGGFYPSGGITLGPALTFGYIAAHDAAGIDPGGAGRVVEGGGASSLMSPSPSPSP